ncbi:MAG: hypothetical protein WA323_25290 [Candidatus Nitrosopolaris sp.]
MNSNHESGSSSSKPLICIYTNNEKNEFAIGFREDENFRAVTKLGDIYTRFVDAFESTLITNDIDWQEELKKWIVAAKKNESIFLEIDLSGWNEAGERRLSVDYRQFKALP